MRRQAINAESAATSPSEQRSEVERAPGSAGKRRKRLPRRLKVAAAIGAAIAGAAALVAFALLDSDPDSSAPGPGPAIEASAPSPGDEPAAAEAAAELGFPAFATKNTTRVGGATPAADAAGVALATFPSAGGSEPPQAVALVGEEDWTAGIAAGVLMAEPLRVPTLISSSDGLPEETENAITALHPAGSAETEGAQVFAVGDVDVPGGPLEVSRIGARGPAAVAAAIERLRSRLVGFDPDHVLIAPAGQPAFAMPAAAWAARSGDPVLFAGEDALPKPTAKALKRLGQVPVYVLGPSSAISSAVVRKISRIAGRVRRVSGEDPVTNAIEFARYADGDFGWNINDPGHGFVVARSDRPLDAAAAAPLSASGTWGPLLLTDSADALPGALRGYLLDVKPGYRNDPTRAFYNHVWVIGDQAAIGVGQQAAIDDLAELAKIGDEPGEAQR